MQPQSNFEMVEHRFFGVLPVLLQVVPNGELDVIGGRRLILILLITTIYITFFVFPFFTLRAE